MTEKTLIQTASVPSVSPVTDNGERIRLLEAVVENFPGGLLLFDRNLKLVFCNQAQRNLLDYPDSLFAGGAPSLEEIFWFNARRGEYGRGEPIDQVASRMHLVHQNVEHTYERVRPNGTILLIRGQPLPGGGFVTTYLDVTEQRRGQQALQYLAHHDLTTQLSNKAALLGELGERIARINDDREVAVHFLDLNKFKPVNDTYGHATGDILLRHVASRLKSALRSTDFVYRYGGDEFVIVQSHVKSRLDTDSVAYRVLEGLDRSFEIEGHAIRVGASIGIALFPSDGQTPAELIASADTAMYKSKLGHGAFVYFGDLTKGVVPAQQPGLAEMRVAFE